MKVKKSMKRAPRVSTIDFVTAWQKSGSLEEVAEKTGLMRTGLTTRAANYRKRGIPLQRFKGARGSPALDVRGLAALAKSLAKNGK